MGVNSAIGAKLLLAGGSMAMLGLLLAAGVFGITFGTAGLIVAGLFLFVYGMTFQTSANRNLNFVLSLTRKLLSIVLMLGLVSFVGIEALILRAAKSDDRMNLQYAVVLGAGIQGDQPSLILKRRLDRSIDYLNANPGAEIVVSGGLGPGTSITEAEVMKRYLVAQQVDEARILKEEKSTTSEENVRFSQQLLSSVHGEPPPAVLIITSDYHMFRAKRIAGKYYSEVYGLSAATPVTTMINYAVREYLATLKMLVISS